MLLLLLCLRIESAIDTRFRGSGLTAVAASAVL